MNIPENFDRWMFDYKEGNLSGSELQEFENFLIQNPEFEIEADAWENAFIRNEEFVYEDMHKLEKHNRFTGSYKWAAAAAILLLIGGSATIWVLNSDETIPSSGYAGVNPLENMDRSAYSSILPGQNETDQTKNLSSNPFNGSNPNGSSTTVYTNNGAETTSNSNVGTNHELSSNPNDQGDNTFSNTPVNSGTPVNHSAVENVALNQEIAKYEAEKSESKYQGNPDVSDLSFEVNKKKSLNYNSFGRKLKRIYRKIERAFGYPVGLKNLRDPEIVLPQNVLLANNPGFTGGSLKPRFEMNYRNQWWGSDQNSQSLTMSFDDYSANLKGGYGVMVGIQDYGLGGYNDVNVSLFYSPKITLGQNFVFEPAIKLTMGSVSANTEKLQELPGLEMNKGRVIDMAGTQNVDGTSRLWYKDYGLGFVLNSEWFYAGFSADNLSGHYENVFAGDSPTPSRIPTKISAIVGSDYENVAKTVTFSPFIAYERFDKTNEAWGGFNLRLNWATIGGSVSTSKEFIASAGVRFDQFRLVYRYDRTHSQFLPETVGSHSIGIRINGKAKRKPALRN